MSGEVIAGLKILMAESHRKMILADCPTGGIIFEWGTGGTSVWLARAITDDITTGLISLEHHPAWHKKTVDAMIEVFDGLQKSPWCGILSVPQDGYAFPNATRQEEDGSLLTNYIQIGAAIAGTIADVVLIDGVARSACLAALVGRLAANNRRPIIYIHDTHRDWYDAAIMDACQALELKSAPQKIPQLPGEYPATITRLS